MKPNSTFRLLLSTVAALTLFAFGALPGWAQTASGSVTVQVRDQSGAVLPGAQLKLVNLATRSVRTGASQSQGSYTFVNVPPGTYSLSVTRHGFQTTEFRSVTVQVAQVTDLTAKLKVGSVSSTVEVSGNAVPLVATTTNAIGTTINLQQVNELPLAGRDITQLAQLIPGAVNSNGITTWDGVPTAAQGNQINGVISSSSRMKFGGNAQPAVSARLEDMSQMTIQTDQLGVNQSSGQNDMQINFLTKSGTNQFHGSVFEDFINSGLNANSWYNNAIGLKRGTLILNDFGFTLGGPIIHNKLFFYGSFATSRQPGSYTTSNSYLNPAAQTGLFTFADNNGNLHTVNVLTQIAQPNNLPSTLNTEVASQLQAINGGVTAGAVSKATDPNLNQVGWLVQSPITQYYPDLRLDYDVSPKVRLDFNYMETKSSQPGAQAPALPGAAFADREAGNYSSNYIGGLGVDWTISPTMVNAFRGGYLYDATWFAPDAKPLYLTQPIINYGLGASGLTYPTPITTYYPVVNFTDTLSWQTGSHFFSFGGDFYREQDHYWNAPLGYANINLGVGSTDPASTDFASYFNTNYLGSNGQPDYPTSALSEAEALYATLTGRIESVNGQQALNRQTHQYINGIGVYPLDELQKAWGLFFEDSYHLTSNLTLNYGLRWDFTGDDYDLTSAYTSASLANIYGPTAIGQLFEPGQLNGVADPVLTSRAHQYNPWNFSPQPNFGFAWNPNIRGGFLGRLMGGQNTVIRAGYSLRDYTEPQQFFWNTATDGGFNYYQGFSLNEATGGAPGTFVPGSLALGDTLPAYAYTPTKFSATVPMSELTYSYSAYGDDGMNPNIGQPYIQSWNFGIQRRLGQSNALDIRYIGNHTVHQWIALDPNEINVFSNGFLAEFKQAEANLRINKANGKDGTFADNGYAGEGPTPILTTAGVSPTDGTMLTDLSTGAVGAAASDIVNNPNYLCAMIGSKAFSPCNAYVGSGVTGAYPINFWQANPFGAGTNGPPYIGLGSAGYMTDAGSGNYNALQLEFKQKQWHGMEFDVNYTWAHTLGIEPGNSWTGSFNNFTIRNLQLSYGPTLFDIRQTFNAYGTYQLPFGTSKAFLNTPGVLNDVLGNWTVGTIITLHSGAPFLLTGGYQTYNDFADGGVVFTGSTLAALQKSIGVYSAPGPYSFTINPSFLSAATGGAANPSDMVPNTTAGTLASNYWLHGPSFFDQDLSLTKSIALTERWHLQLQGEFLNLYNNVEWGNPVAAVQSSSFGTAGTINAPRSIQFRARVTF